MEAKRLHESVLVKPIENAEPTYCFVLIQRRCELSIEGWLLLADDPDYFLIQPSVAYDPELTKIAFHIDDVLSITPSFPPTPYTASAITSASEVDDYAYFNPERENILSPTQAAKFVHEFMQI